MSAEPTSPFAPDGAPLVLPRGPHGLARDVVLASQRGRLLSAFVKLAADRGVAAVTISDIVREAGTAKRTFYEHFRDKDDCFLQAFEVASELMVGTVVDTVAAEPDPVLRIARGARAYLEALVAHPEFTRLFLTHMRAGGPQLAQRWTAWVESLANVLVQWREESRQARPDLGLPSLTTLQATAAISAVNEIVSITLLRDGIDGIGPVSDELVALTVAFLTADPRPR
ncbi:MAG TPA: helix-turn-helix domain-containing protein [Baekduia sp.]|uniref:TetR/AcrR family transcriptional regulator n=1 Tax=Baekduia sp. TaxID=2600305 RepID=UPI002D773EEC|nr:helix-turn-helix domain-containing protein [Baekduia sp.]HET6508674.1 helix-turn-helix domain-containing protein [Baekduia sp.]